jgi:hypothetical protein
MIQLIKDRKFGIIQTAVPITEMLRPYDHFPNEMIDAISDSYTLVRRDDDRVFYAPRPIGTAQ